MEVQVDEHQFLETQEAVLLDKVMLVVIQLTLHSMLAVVVVVRVLLVEMLLAVLLALAVLVHPFL